MGEQQVGTGGAALGCLPSEALPDKGRIKDVVFGERPT
jgi:hypothetical protein